MRRWLKALRLRFRLRSRKTQRRVEAAQALGELQPACAVGLLIRALGDDAWGVRRAAEAALGKFDTDRLVGRLIEALGHSRRSVRLGVAELLGRSRDPRAVEPLIKALDDREFKVRGAAAMALGKIGDPRAKEPRVLARINSILLQAAEEQARLRSSVRSSFPDSYGGSERTSAMIDQGAKPR